MHGAMVMQLHWSMVQWTFLSKILKKHDKMTGILLRQPMLNRLVQEPFFSSKILERLIKELEELYMGLAPGSADERAASGADSGGAALGGGGEGRHLQGPILGTRAAEVQARFFLNFSFFPLNLMSYIHRYIICVHTVVGWTRNGSLLAKYL